MNKALLSMLLAVAILFSSFTGAVWARQEKAPDGIWDANLTSAVANESDFVTDRDTDIEATEQEHTLTERFEATPTSAVPAVPDFIGDNNDAVATDTDARPPAPDTGGSAPVPEPPFATPTTATPTTAIHPMRMASAVAGTLGSQAIGATVNIKINGSTWEFIVVQHGKPASFYDDSFNGGTMLLMKDLYEQRQWHDTRMSDYENSNIHSYLNGDFYNLIESGVRDQIRTVKIPYRPGSGTASMTVNTGANGLACKLFLLSCYELNWANNPSDFNTLMTEDGATLAYFAGTADPDSKRIGYLNGAANSWWLRSPYVSRYGATVTCYLVSENGAHHGTSADAETGIRPALVLPSNLEIDAGGSIITNQPPTTPGNITVPATVNGGDTITISWNASTDPDSNLAGYRLERSVNGGAWSQIYQGSATSTTNTIAAGISTVAYRVKAYDAAGAESAYRTSLTRTVVNNTAPAVPGSITIPSSIKYAAAFSVSWGEANDADGNLSGYRLERQMNGGAWAQIYQGTETTYTDTLTRDEAASVNYRVKAYDALGAESAYQTGPARTVSNNVAPISLGTPAAGEDNVNAWENSAITYTWAAATDADSDDITYEVERNVNGGGWAVVATSANRTYTHNITATDNTVQIRVRAYDGREYSGYATSAQTAITHDAAPTAVTTVSFPASITYGVEYTVSWSAATSVTDTVTGYILERQLNGGEWVEIYDGSALIYEDTLTRDAANTVNYRVKAYSITALESGYTTGTAASITNNRLPTAPISPSAEASVSSWLESAVSYTWGVSTDADGDSVTYSVERKRNGGEWEAVGTTATPSWQHSIDPGDETVQLRVRAYDGREYSAYAESGETAIVHDAAPAAPAGITFPSTVTYGIAYIISWQAATSSTDTVIGYVLERQLDGGEWTELYNGSALTYEDTLTRDTADTVNYRVKAYSVTGLESGYTTGTAASVTNNRLPTAPVSPTAPATVRSWLDSSVVYTWGASTDADGDPVVYHIERKLNDGEWESVGTTTVPSWQHFISPTDEAVQIRVRASDSRGFSAYVNSGETAIIHDRPPSAAAFISFPASIPYGTDYTVFWAAAISDNDTLAGYRLERQLDGGTWTQIYNGASTSYQDSLARDEAEAVNYRYLAYSVTGLESGYTTGEAATVINNTAPTAPGVPIADTTVNAWQRSAVAFTWATAIDNDGDAIAYNIEGRVNNGAWQPLGTTSATAYQHTIADADESMLLRVRASDSRAFSVYAQSLRTEIRHDTAAPTIDFTFAERVSVYLPYTVHIRATDSDSGVTGITLPDGSTVNGAAAQYTIRANGENVIKAVDAAGNEARYQVIISDIRPLYPDGSTVTDNGDGTVMVTVPGKDGVPGTGDDVTVTIPKGSAVEDNRDGSVTVIMPGRDGIPGTGDDVIVTVPGGCTVRDNGNGTASVTTPGRDGIPGTRDDVTVIVPGGGKVTGNESSGGNSGNNHGGHDRDNERESDRGSSRGDSGGNLAPEGSPPVEAQAPQTQPQAVPEAPAQTGQGAPSYAGGGAGSGTTDGGDDTSSDSTGRDTYSHVDEPDNTEHSDVEDDDTEETGVESVQIITQSQPNEEETVRSDSSQKSPISGNAILILCLILLLVILIAAYMHNRNKR